jgi:hypothetical protein
MAGATRNRRRQLAACCFGGVIRSLCDDVGKRLQRHIQTTAPVKPEYDHELDRSFGTSSPTTRKGGYGVRRSFLTLLSLIGALVSLAGCGSLSPTGPSGSTGTVTGILQAVGGPPGIRSRALSGEVTFIDLNRTRRNSVTVGANGRFSVPAPVGRFSVSGRSTQYEGGAAVCRASGPVVVTKGVTSSVEIDCQEM